MPKLHIAVSLERRFNFRVGRIAILASSDINNLRAAGTDRRSGLPNLFSLMHVEKLSIEELKLLVLLEMTRSLKDSAVRLNVSTPTASRMLARLRAALDDELFVRSASVMTPTHACLRHLPRIERVLKEMEALVREPQVFSPASLKRNFRVMLHEQLFLAHFAAVAKEVRRMAPGVGIVVESVSDSGSEALKTGELDAVVFPMTDNVSPEIKAQHLIDADFDILVREGHPWLETFDSGDPDAAPNWAELAKFSKIETTIDSFGTRAPGGLDHWLLKGKLPEQPTALWCPYVQAASELLESSDLTMVMYSPLAKHLAARGGLKRVPLAALDCSYPLGLLWHARRDADPALEWLKAVFVSCFKATR